MKLSGWLLRISLILMITLSIVLTWLIWQNPSRLGHQPTTAPVTRRTEAGPAKGAGLVMAPTTAYYQHQGSKQMLFTPDENTASALRTAMHGWRLTTVTAGGKLTVAEYNALLSVDDTIQLVYPDQMAYRTFDTAFFAKSATKNNRDFSFNRVIVNLARHQQTLVFVNDATRTLHTGVLKPHSLKKVDKVLAAASATSWPIVEKRLANGRQVPEFTSAINVQPYVYLLDQQSANHYVSLLMPTTTAAAVDARELGVDTVYTAGTDYRLTLNTDTDVLQFDNATAVAAATSLNANLSKSYSALGKLDLLGLSTMRYYRYHKADHKVTYRAYAQGLPIFNQNYYGRVTVATTDSGQQMFFSMNNLTVPIPTNQARTPLPPTAAVWDHLHAVGYHDSDIEDITLGYYWQPQKENSQVVNLTPTYFVEINGQYRRYLKWQGPDEDKSTRD